jgi:hypothetical protein
VLLEEPEEADAELLPLPAAVLEPGVAPLPVALAPVGLVLLVAVPVPVPVPVSLVDEPGDAAGPAFGSLGDELGAAGGSF